MKRFFFFALLMSSFLVMARENASFFYSGFEGRNRAFYACDYVEARTQASLELLGATEIEVYCSGGITNFGPPRPVSVQAYFELPVLSGNEEPQIIEVKGDVWNPNCGLNVKIMDSLLPKFSNVEVLKKNNSCPFMNSNFSYTLSIRK